MINELTLPFVQKRMMVDYLDTIKKQNVVKYDEEKLFKLTKEAFRVIKRGTYYHDVPDKLCYIATETLKQLKKVKI